MTKTLVYSAKVSPKVKSSGGKYEIGSFQVGERIITPSERYGTVSSVRGKKITITWDNGLSAEYTAKQMQNWNYKKSSEDKETYSVGQRVKVAYHKEKYYSDWNWGIITNISSKKIDVKMGNRFIIAVDIADIQIQENIKCDNLTSAQEWVQDSPLQPQNSEDLSLSDLQRLTNTAQASSANDSQVYTTTGMCEVSLVEKLENNGEQLTSSQLPHPASPSQSKASDKDKPTLETVSPPSNEPLNQSDQGSSVSKTSQDCSTAHSPQNEQHSIFSTSYARLPASATIRNGFVSVQGTLAAPTLENDYCWLESPGALSNGKGRPPGQSKQESQLKKLKVLAPAQVVNPEFLESAYNLPLGWTDPQENKSALEFLAKTEPSAIAVPPSAMPLTGELPPLDFAASPTSIPYAKNQPQQFKAITLHQPWAYLVGRYKWFETRTWPTNYRGKIAIHAAQKQDDTDYWCSLLNDLLPPIEELIFGVVVAVADLTDCILMTEEFINQQSPTELRCGNWKLGCYAWKLENIQILSEPIPAKGQQRLWNIELSIPIPHSLCPIPYAQSMQCTPQKQDVHCPSCESPLITLNEGCGVCGWTHEIFLEEKREAPSSAQKLKPSKQKGCLYKYLENKKLKDGTIASYPRVIGDRKSDNPNHWRWGFNWEEKIDGEWKGRSINSIPVGAIPLIKSMQNEGIPLKEIIEFIKRAKNKKS